MTQTAATTLRPPTTLIPVIETLANTGAGLTDVARRFGDYQVVVQQGIPPVMQQLFLQEVQPCAQWLGGCARQLLDSAGQTIWQINALGAKLLGFCGYLHAHLDEIKATKSQTWLDRGRSVLVRGHIENEISALADALDAMKTSTTSLRSQTRDVDTQLDAYLAALDARQTQMREGSSYAYGQYKQFQDVFAQGMQSGRFLTPDGENLNAMGWEVMREGSFWAFQGNVEQSAYFKDFLQGAILNVLGIFKTEGAAISDAFVKLGAGWNDLARSAGDLRDDLRDTREDYPSALTDMTQDDLSSLADDWSQVRAALARIS